MSQSGLEKGQVALASRPAAPYQGPVMDEHSEADNGRSADPDAAGRAGTAATDVPRGESHEDSSVFQILPPIDGPLELRARGRFRLACFGGFLFMAALVAALCFLALPQVERLEVSGYGGTDQALLEQAKQAMHLMAWAVMAFSGLIGLWCLFCSRPGSRRLELELDNEELRFRPFLGRRRRIPVEQFRQIDERRGRFLRPAHLLLRWRKRRKLKLYCWWYGAEHFEQLRQQLGRVSMSSSTSVEPVVDEQPSDAGSEPGAEQGVEGDVHQDGNKTSE